ncbi:PaaX [Halioglobus maricola]|uniref:PaaX n=1 Tax=Halioglobus maricola TaxID=2601894 RepID=A0A5P9NJT9_9GAMM|nr:PaaX [Halioglobus maricola]QFU75795.1 PaaX [Halioglobus maricola]
MFDAENPSPKRLVLSLLSAPSLPEVGVGLLLRWGELFEIDAATMRVTVGRLTRQGLLSSPQRGIYRMGPEGELIASTARDWVNAETRIGPWRGGWIAVHTSHLGRVNRTALRARERAFRLNGFAEYVTGLWYRPANLRESSSATRARLLSLGLEPEAIVMQSEDMPGVSEKELFALWPREYLETAYISHITNMQESTDRAGKLPLPEATRETLLVGEAVIRQINADPLLPDAIVDGRNRRRMINAMVRYNKFGQDIWQQFVSNG